MNVHPKLKCDKNCKKLAKRALAKPTEKLRARFTAILPFLQNMAQRYFRNYRDRFDREEALLETTAMAWARFLRLIKRGLDPTRFVASLAWRSAQAVHRGRKVPGGTWSMREPLNPLVRIRHGFHVFSLPRYEDHGELWQECLHAKGTPVPEAVAFRIDFAAWRRLQTRRDLDVIDALIRGDSIKAVADRLGLTKSAIKQRRRRYRESWRQFTGELAA